MNPVLNIKNIGGIEMKENFKEKVKDAIRLGHCKHLTCSECRKLTKSEEHGLASVCFDKHLQEFKNIVK
jgi:hypothetical protein